MNGFNGKVLRVDLSSSSFEVEERDEIFYRRYLGGECFVAFTLLKELRPGVDPLGPDNLLIFSTGIFTGAPLGGSGRQSVGAKSPLTGGFGESEAGGYWGAEFKQAGFDAIIIKGASKEPVYLWIHDGEFELRDASSLMGKPTAVVEGLIQSELDDKRIRVAQTGPGGERLVRFASVMFDINRAAGRTGMGAVMGSKNLKAIAVRGRKRVKVAHKEIVRESAQWLAGDVDNLAGGLKKHGTAGATIYQHMTNSLPTYNFREGHFATAEQISGETMTDTILVERDTCYACPIYCKRVVEVEENGETGKTRVDRIYGGPEFETIGAFGSMCGIDDLEAVAKANEMCNAFGLDTISAGVTISFAMECFEQGLLTAEETGGIELSFGNAQAMIETLRLIIERKGVGKLLGEGSLRAAREIGDEAIDLVMHVKGQEIPQQEPRAMHGLGLGYAVSPTGADHMHNMYDRAYADADTPRMKKVAALGILEPVPYDVINAPKVRMFIYITNWLHMVNSIGMCMFMPYDHGRVRDIIHGITGWNVTIWELMRAGERAVNLARLFNVREGLTADKDTLPKRFGKALGSDSSPHPGITSEELRQGVELYYAMMGWDSETGIPSDHKLHELDLSWAIDPQSESR